MTRQSFPFRLVIGSAVLAALIGISGCGSESSSYEQSPVSEEIAQSGLGFLETQELAVVIDSVAMTSIPLAQDGEIIDQEMLQVFYTTTVIGNDPIEQCLLPTPYATDELLTSTGEIAFTGEEDCRELQPGESVTREAQVEHESAANTQTLYFISPLEDLSGFRLAGTIDLSLEE